ncbi:hypothetical protein E4V42_22010 [Clostridium estertheticum]|uniref:Uncharacterized protein n=1 Tax=Clostridium estertheticum TaxID=238834 RepID=A0A5N7IUU4_9CLOT|nr:hypothetical protein [Clostridium estertheticum]MPQ34070.1 hypothetical protein [Clostridium estertheticum]MPQ64871.1 hypothetical protein [Clostridium estertheticum]
MVLQTPNKSMIKAVFLICMRLRKFSKAKHTSEADLNKDTYKTEIEVNKCIKLKPNKKELFRR